MARRPGRRESPIVTGIASPPGFARSCATIASESSMPLTRTPRAARGGRPAPSRSRARAPVGRRRALPAVDRRAEGLRREHRGGVLVVAWSDVRSEVVLRHAARVSGKRAEVQAARSSTRRRLEHRAGHDVQRRGPSALVVRAPGGGRDLGHRGDQHRADDRVVLRAGAVLDMASAELLKHRHDCGEIAKEIANQHQRAEQHRLLAPEVRAREKRPDGGAANTRA